MTAWPELPVAAWTETRDTVHMWTQIVGKIRLALMPPRNQWWQTTLYVDARGLTTGLMPYRETGLEIAFDFRRHRLVIDTVDGARRELSLEPRTVADFYEDVFAQLRDLGVDVTIYARPVEIPVAIPFAEDTQHASYDGDSMHRFWQSLVHAQRIFTEFRSRYTGKVSPVHFFWGAFDLAVTRFSGRPAPRYTGEVPNCPTWVMERAYNEEVSSAGYWAGGSEEGSFYAYAYPEPDGFRQHPVAPSNAYFDEALGEFILPYADVRRTADPDAMVLEFLQTTYEAAAVRADWDRALLEFVPPSE
jgi:hypothetical protein